MGSDKRQRERRGGGSVHHCHRSQPQHCVSPQQPEQWGQHKVSSSSAYDSLLSLKPARMPTECNPLEEPGSLLLPPRAGEPDPLDIFGPQVYALMSASNKNTGSA